MLRPPSTTTKNSPQRVTAEAAGASKPRLGQISFANCLPVYLPLQRQHVELNADIVFESPAQLNQMFEQGQLEIGSISSFYYLTRDDLRLCPDISISCIGEVGSVLFFSKEEPANLRSSLLVGSAQSATSINLLKILFAEEYGFIPYIESDLRPDLQDDRFAGALVIGDRALEVDTDWSQRYLRIDLGQWWYQRYGLPMVFGVWAARADWIDREPVRFGEITSALRTAKMLGLTRRWKDTLHEAHRRTGLSLSRLERYYKHELNFDFGEDHAQGLALYQQLLKRHSLL